MPYGPPDFCSAFYFSLKQIVESCTEINFLQGYNNLFGCFEVLVLKNRVKQLTLLTFCKNLKNLRKLDIFSSSKDFDGTNTLVKNNFTNFKCCIPMRIGHICLPTYFCGNARRSF